MGLRKHVTEFNPEVLRATERAMAEARESVTAPAQRHFQQTGSVHGLVDVLSRRKVSHNAMTRKGDQFILELGIALSIVSWVDGTNSFERFYRLVFGSIGNFHHMLEWLDPRYNRQLSTGIVQDVDDRYPVVQQTEYETGAQIVEQMRHLAIANSGGDSTEDYDLALLQILLNNEFDIHRYGLLPYGFLNADEVGRGTIKPATAWRHLGIELQSTMDTAEIGHRLVETMHFYYLLVREDRATRNWWTEVLGNGRVVALPKAELAAPMQAALIYVGEQQKVDERQVIDFLVESTQGTNQPVSNADARLVYRAIDEAGVDIGAQVNRPGYDEIPLPGSVFADLRDTWPIDHPNAGENDKLKRKNSEPPGVVFHDGDDAGSVETDETDWNLF